MCLENEQLVNFIILIIITRGNLLNKHFTSGKIKKG